ncbi:Polyphosphate kinase [Candidatus Sulfotelmatobacter kueseliae]|uniref:Polyphosphate kinase n=1 Tax=Candidatus Sulfotelmatobacter kueseliae TaxID=2042962 RepID=A0A2U3K239_9BACT|nr:Polyphosphate kinase [Candidatus Sulfotelmatobacter kueseliae]
MARISLDNPQYFLNRDTSWLAFNRRVLEEAEDEGNPLLERLKFLSISASNMDEFFEVRIAGMMQQIEDGYNEAGPDGHTLTAKRDLLNQLTHEFVDDQYDCWNARLRPALAENGIRVLGLEELDPEALRFVNEYCEKELDPLLTPVTVDPAHPFPRVINKALCLGFLLRRRRRSSLTYTGVVSVPRALPRLVPLPSEGTADFIFLADLVAHHAVRMYHGYDIVAAAPFRVTRNSNLYLAEEEARSLLESVRTELHNRRKGDAVRLEIEADADPEIIDRLRSVFEIDAWQVFPVNGPVNLSRLFNIYEQVRRPDLKYRPFTARELRLTSKSKDLFEELRQHDILLHHPYDSYDAVVSFIEAAAEDENVLSIKQTLYRTSEHSLIVPSLIDAASRKEVTAVVELKARFDEASNIRWARDLEDAGVQVFHGLVGLKTHCKLSLLVRRDPDGVTRSYAHIGTGNYNATTARIYTDLSLLTANPEVTRAVHDVFSFLTAYAENPSYEPLLVAPLDLAEKCIALIEREAEHARQGRVAHIVAKMNALLDKNIVQALYRASQAGVEIDLIVRGICALRPGVRGVSDHIRVRSIVGRFLEHSRIYYFANGGEEEVYIGSADWMPRNLYERVEALVPLRDELLRERVKREILDAYLADNRKARLLLKDATYIRAWQPVHGKRNRRPPTGAAAFSAQDFLISLAEGKAPAVLPAPVPARRRKVTVGKER